MASGTASGTHVAHALAAVLLITCLFCNSSAPISARSLAQQQRGQADPLSNLVSAQPTTKYQQRQGASNDTLKVFQVDGVARLAGAHLIPFTADTQRLVIQAFNEQISENGPVMITSYKEFYPDPAEPDGIRDSSPGVDFSFTHWWVLEKAAPEYYTTWDATGRQIYMLFLGWGATIRALGDLDKNPQVSYVNIMPEVFQGDYILHPLVVLDTELKVTIIPVAPDRVDMLLAEHVSMVADALEAAIEGRIGTLVEAVRYKQQGNASLVHSVQLEVTLFVCRDNATVPSPECEQQVLAAVLAQLLQSEQVQQQWQAAGIQSVEVVGISQRQAPSPPSNSTVMETSQPWVPWHLDRIDQRSLPLDGQYTASADGTSVNVYIISSGILDGHYEFGYLDGAPGSRVRKAFSYDGLNPLEDCPDYSDWFGYGTFAASMCCGLQLGVAKNATILSVRFRQDCLSDPSIWAAGALPAAMDTVMSAVVKPAVVLIDTWWSVDRQAGNLNDNLAVKEQLELRLDNFLANNITVIASAGPGLNKYSACSNVIASHPAVVSVAASDIYDQATNFGPQNSDCIDIWAPSGGLGTAQIGAYPLSNTSYIRVVNRAAGAAPLVAGLAAQYLQLHPDATATEVRNALLAMATPHIVTGAGPASPTSLIFTNFTQPSAVPDSGLETGAIVGIALAAAAAMIGSVWVGWILIMRRRRPGPSIANTHSTQKLEQSGWEVGYDEIQICKRPDGSDWVLGVGRYGKVYKAIKSGVQVVAVKQLKNVDEQFRALIINEIQVMQFASRDANICQFYGASIQGDDMMVVVELMEGGDLHSALTSDKAAELQWLQRGKDVMLDLVRGTHFLHANHVIHRNITSRNALLTRDGRAKLTDIHGLAQKNDEQESSQPNLGRLAWAAPEVLLGEECSEKADIYSLGVVLWEVVTRGKPQRGHMRDPEVPLECPLGVADAIRACMQLDPAQRPSARELYDLLLACPPSRDYEPASLPSTASEAAFTSEDSKLTRTTYGEAECGGNCSREKPASSLTSDGDLVAVSSQNGKSCLTSNPNLGAPLSSTDLAIATIAFSKLEFCKNADGSNQKLGSGSFGAVYKVLLDGVQPLAVKVVALGQDPHLQLAFLQEAGLLWRLRHRNIVGLSGVSISEDQQGYLLMELMEGGSLYHSLNATKKGTNLRIFGWYQRGRQTVLEISRAMHYLHSLRVTHFDLKSANVLLAKDLTTKLADVGLARIMSRTHHSLREEAAGTGTFAYMAPELLAGYKCTESVDIYSFGILLLEICTGTHPIRSRALKLNVPQDCPQEVADLYLECTAADPAARPTAREVVERLANMNAPN